MKFRQLYWIVIVFSILSCKQESSQVLVSSPSQNITVMLSLDESGSPLYSVSFNGKNVILPSSMGFDFINAPELKYDLAITDVIKTSTDETWDMPWGEQLHVENKYNECFIILQETQKPYRKFNIIFRVFDDGLGFRYEFPKEFAHDEVIINDEHTEFNLSGDHTVWWIPGDWDIYEHLYNTTTFSEIDAIKYRNHSSLAQSYIPNNAVNTPVTMKTNDGVYLSFHEANLTDYAGMTLKVDKEKLSMTSALVGSDQFGYNVKRSTPFQTPWRTIQISNRAGDLIDSKLILNLNDPNKLGDISWFTPTKYMGIWWEMHVGKSSWDMASGRHGATTENAKSFIDFSSENGIGAVLIEGWNTGWERWFGIPDREDIFDFVTPYPDYDLEAVVSYGKVKGVDIIMHHETSAAPRTYEQQLDTAFALMKTYGMHTVKTGYVGTILPEGEYHHGQWMVNHYRKVVETAAKYEVAVNAHEPIKATGIRRTYPNAISREGLRGQEFNAWAQDGGNPPEHLTIVPFTRMLAGPIDFTPGVFNLKLDPYKDQNQINTTLAHQLAIYVVIYSPVQMACDLIENYQDHPAFQFIRDVGVDWSESHVIDGEIGDFISMARKERNSDKWFVGCLTDENPRELPLVLDFLDLDKTYMAVIYSDGVTAHWNDNPTSIKIENLRVQKGDELDLRLAAGGGCAISLIPVSN